MLYGSDVRPHRVLCGLLLRIASLWTRCSPPARLIVPYVAHICSIDPMLISAASYEAFCCAQLLLRTRSGMSRRTRMMAGRRTRRRRRRKKGISSKSPPGGNQVDGLPPAPVPPVSRTRMRGGDLPATYCSACSKLEMLDSLTLAFKIDENPRPA